MSEEQLETKVLELSSYVGKVILKNGGEVSRAEDVITRFGKFYGYSIEAFATLTCICVSMKGKDGKYHSEITRIKTRELNLFRVFLVNNLMRNLDKYSYNEFYEELKNIEKNHNVEFLRSIFGCIMISSGFTLMFNAGFYEAFIAGIGGFFLAFLINLLNKFKVNSFIINILGAILCSFVACYATYLGYTKETSTIIISQLMIFVPGIAFVNTIRDLLFGDLLAGLSRFTEVLMVAISLAVGTGIVFKIYTVLGGVIY